MIVDEKSLTSKGRVPAGVYTCRITEVKQEPSAEKGTEMDVISCEIVSPEKKKFGDVEYEVAGTEFTIRIFYTQKAAARAKETLRQFGINPTGNDTSEWQKESKKLEGAYFDIALQSTPRVMRHALTPDEIAAGKKDYEAEPVKDDDGKVVTLGWELNANPNGIRAGTLRRATSANPY